MIRMVLRCSRNLIACACTVVPLGREQKIGDGKWEARDKEQKIGSGNRNAGYGATWITISGRKSAAPSSSCVVRYRLFPLYTRVHRVGKQKEISA